MELNEIMKKFVEQKKIEIPHLKAVLFYGSSCYKLPLMEVPCEEKR